MIFFPAQTGLCHFYMFILVKCLVNLERGSDSSFNNSLYPTCFFFSSFFRNDLKDSYFVSSVMEKSRIYEHASLKASHGNKGKFRVTTQNMLSVYLRPNKCVQCFLIKHSQSKYFKHTCQHLGFKVLENTEISCAYALWMRWQMGWDTMDSIECVKWLLKIKFSEQCKLWDFQGWDNKMGEFFNG